VKIDPLQWPVPVDLMVDCNFDSLAKEEEEAAYYFEHAREIRWMRGKVRRKKEEGRKEEKELWGKSILKRQLVRLLAGTGFPKPWQRLSKAARTQLMERVPEVMALLEVRQALCMIPTDEWPAEFGLREFRARVVERVGPGRVIAGGFAVNLAAGRGAIEREFSRWLERELRRAKEMGEDLEAFSFKGPGPTGWRSGLNRLGALRWRYHVKRSCLTFRKAKALPD
jgi:hypothetical protein